MLYRDDFVCLEAKMIFSSMCNEMGNQVSLVLLPRDASLIIFDLVRSGTEPKR